MLLLVHRPDDWEPAADLGLDARASTALFAARWHAHVSGPRSTLASYAPPGTPESPASPSPPSPHRARRWRARRRRTRSVRRRHAGRRGRGSGRGGERRRGRRRRADVAGSLDSRELDSEPGGFEDERALSADESDNDVDDFESSSVADSTTAGATAPARAASRAAEMHGGRRRALVLDRGGDDADDGAARPSRILAQVGALPRRELRSGDSFELARVREDLRGCVHSAAAALDVADAAADADGAASYSGSGTSGAQGATRVRKTSSMGAALAAKSAAAAWKQAGKVATAFRRTSAPDLPQSAADTPRPNGAAGDGVDEPRGQPSHSLKQSPDDASQAFVYSSRAAAAADAAGTATNRERRARRDRAPRRHRGHDDVQDDCTGRAWARAARAGARARDADASVARSISWSPRCASRR